MTKLDKHVLKKILETTKHPNVPGSYFDKNFRRKEAEELLKGVPNITLLDQPMFKAGYERAYQQVKEKLEFMLTATVPDMIRFAGRPKGKKKGGKK